MFKIFITILIITLIGNGICMECPSKVSDKTTKSDCLKDSDCSNDLKCCNINNSSYCAEPCQIMMCKCMENSTLIYVPNENGCPVCQCKPNPKSTTTSKNVVKSKNVCELIPDSGPCRAVKQRYYFSMKTKRCVTFSYGGCLGNGNNFHTLEECQGTCAKSTKSLKDFCNLPVDQGPCKASFRNFFFNSTSKMCEEFAYGGCLGNENRFSKLTDCQNACKSNTTERKSNTTSSVIVVRSDICTQEKKVGLCRGHLERYWFNTASNQCELFTYGGCGGNSNNFETLEECQGKCSNENSTVKNQNICDLSPIVGKCKAYLERYFYNNTANECQQFIYGGCDGNLNNFNDLNECQIACPAPKNNKIEKISQDQSNICTQEKKVGLCRGHIERYWFNTASNQCELFIYGGCGGNSNNFETLEECQGKCSNNNLKNNINIVKNNDCESLPDSGLCYGYFESFFYNSTSNTCGKFIYGGCGGNNNRYENQEDCLKTCSLTNKQDDSKESLNDQSNICTQEKQVGFCRGHLERYWFNAASNQCELFIYGGCGGNSNNFETLEECQGKCSNDNLKSNKLVQDKSNICNQEIKVGPCRGRIERYWFNNTSNECNQFYYGGCAGNDNNFETADDCNKICSPTKKNLKDTCSLPPVQGPCRALIFKFFYNSKSKKCEEFSYGGCDGNANNFETIDECLAQCS